MKTFLTLALGAALLTQAATAHAIVAFPSVRTQIRNEAKAEGVMKGMRSPSVRVQIKGNTASAQILSIGRAGVRLVDTRLVQRMATFKLQQLSDGSLAKPVKKNGKIWQTVYHLF